MVVDVNPARAGMIREAARRMSTPPRKPRASGDDPTRALIKRPRRP